MERITIVYRGKIFISRYNTPFICIQRITINHVFFEDKSIVGITEFGNLVSIDFDSIIRFEKAD